jgi:CRP/FNR family transcriptional regulator, cyclic AMP receptor protein
LFLLDVRAMRTRNDRKAPSQELIAQLLKERTWPIILARGYRSEESRSSRAVQNPGFLARQARVGATASEAGFAAWPCYSRFVAELRARQLAALNSRMSVREFSRRTTIYREDQAEMATYILIAGIAKLTCLNRSGKRNLLEVLGPGDVIEIPSLLPDIHHNLSFEAFSDCQLGLISPKELVEGIIGIPFREFSQALNLTVDRWWRLLERHSNFLNQSVRERVALALNDMSIKFGIQEDRGTLINLRLSHRDPAELVDCSRPKTSDCLRGLAREGAVIHEDRRFIVDRAKIQAIVRA